MQASINSQREVAAIAPSIEKLKRSRSSYQEKIRPIDRSAAGNLDLVELCLFHLQRRLFPL